MFLLFAAAAALLLLLQEGAITGSDGQTVYDVTGAIVERGTIHFGPEYPITPNAASGVGGHLYSKYAVGLSLLAIVPYVVAAPVSVLMGHDELVREASVASLVPLICAGVLIAVYAVARRLHASVRASVLVAIGTVFGTYLLPYTAEFFSEPFAALGLLISIERALAKRPGQAALALGLGAVFREQMFALAPVLLVFLVHDNGWRSLRSAIPALVGTLAVALTWNYARFGDFTTSGYAKRGEGFTTPPLEGLHRLFLTADKSLFLYAPVTLLLLLAFRHAWREYRAVATLIALYSLITLALVVTWHQPGGGWAWGPRLLLPVVPAAIALLAPWLDGSTGRYHLAAVLIVLGFVISLPGLVVSMRAQQLDGGHRPSPDIIRQAELIPDRAAYSFRHLGTAEKDDHRRWLDLWQFGAGRELGVKGLLAALPISIALAAVAAASGVDARRHVLQLDSRSPGVTPRQGSR
jgi:hypothetical protein